MAKSFCMATAEAMTPGMAVGDGEDFEDALQGAVLARPAVQNIERDVGLDVASTVAMSRPTSMRVTR